jgi:hypothetical protein
MRVAVRVGRATYRCPAVARARSTNACPPERHGLRLPHREPALSLRDISPKGEGEMRPLAWRNPPFRAHAQPSSASQPLPRGSSRRSRVRGFYENAPRRPQPVSAPRSTAGRCSTAPRARRDARPSLARRSRAPSDVPPACRLTENPLCRCATSPPREKGKCRVPLDENRHSRRTRSGRALQPLPRGSSRRSRVRGFYENAPRRHTNRSAHPARREPPERRAQIERARRQLEHNRSNVIAPPKRGRPPA